MNAHIAYFAGQTPGASSPDQQAPFSLAAHHAHVASLERQGRHEVFGARFLTRSGVYQPDPWSSSVFMVRGLLREGPRMGRLLELGCGAGVVGLSMLRHGLAHSAVLTDIDPACTACARENAHALGLAERADVRLGDLFAPVAGERFDTVIFNMPLLHLAHGGLRHAALDDPHGRLARRFFDDVARHLAPGGRGYFSFSNVSHAELLRGFEQVARVRMMASEWVPSTGFGLALFAFDVAGEGEASGA